MTPVCPALPRRPFRMCAARSFPTAACRRGEYRTPREIRESRERVATILMVAGMVRR